MNKQNYSRIAQGHDEKAALMASRLELQSIPVFLIAFLKRITGAQVEIEIYLTM